MVGDESDAPGGGSDLGDRDTLSGQRERTGFLINGRDEAVPDPPPDPPPPREFERSRKGVQKESILEWKMSGDE